MSRSAAILTAAALALAALLAPAAAQTAPDLATRGLPSASGSHAPDVSVLKDVGTIDAGIAADVPAEPGAIWYQSPDLTGSALTWNGSDLALDKFELTNPTALDAVVWYGAKYDYTTPTGFTNVFFIAIFDSTACKPPLVEAYEPVTGVLTGNLLRMDGLSQTWWFEQARYMLPVSWELPAGTYWLAVQMISDDEGFWLQFSHDYDQRFKANYGGDCPYDNVPDLSFALYGVQGPQPCSGDTNCDGRVTFADIDPFVEALSGESAWNLHHPTCPWLNADCNHSGTVTFADIDPFVAVIGTTCN